MTKNEMKYVIVATIIGIAGYLTLSHYIKHQTVVEEFPLPVAASPKPVPPAGEPPAPAVIRPVDPKVPPKLPPALDAYRKQQMSLIQKFLKLIKLKVTLPLTFQYMDIDLDEGVAGVYAKEGLSRELAILAAAQTGSTEEVISFLNGYKSILPLMGGREFPEGSQVQTLTAPSDSGLSSVQIIPGPELGDFRVMAAYLKRADNKGSYIFIMKAKDSYFDKNDGEFENMLNSMQATP